VITCCRQVPSNISMNSFVHLGFAPNDGTLNMNGNRIMNDQKPIKNYDVTRHLTRSKSGQNIKLNHLFHSHQSYFEKYNSCEMERNASTQCWYDLHKQKSTLTPTISVTT
jgi:hypothetical protein